MSGLFEQLMEQFAEAATVFHDKIVGKTAYAHVNEDSKELEGVHVPEEGEEKIEEPEDEDFVTHDFKLT
uniref:Signal recognition particle-docking protein FtsY n=1 Tax=Steinernema glaseri TaxID=37863 RepID=A0A1I7ZXU3_9BILA